MLFTYTTQDTEPQSGIPWNVQMINAPSFWQRTKGDGAVAAVIDTGCDIHHPELKGRIISPKNFTAIEGPEDVRDTEGHGTHVAGTIAGKTTGVAPEARIMPLKVFGDGNTSMNIQDAYRHVYNWNKTCKPEDKVVAVNCSFGSSAYDPFVANLIRLLIGQEVAVVVAAGNDGDGRADTSEIFHYPGYLWEVITTGALNEDGTAAKYSSSYDGIDVAAPGTQIYSAWPGGGYKKISGTSMATPHETAAALLVAVEFKNRHGRWPTSDELEEILFNHIKPTNIDHRFTGRGILDLTLKKENWPHNKIELTPESHTAKVDGQSIPIDQPAFITDKNRTMVPLRFVGENMGWTVQWTGEKVVMTK